MPTRRTIRRCPICRGTGTLSHDGELTACTCPAGLQVNLGDLAALTADLEVQLARQNTLGDRVGSRSTDTPLPFDGTAGRVLAALRKMLAGWVNELLATGDPAPRNTVPSLAAWLLRQFPRLAHYPQVDELTADVARHVAAARKVIDRPADRVYLGPCKTPGCVELSTQRKPQPTSLYVDPDATTVTCWLCHAEYDVEDRRSELLAVAADRLASAAECARALTSLGEPVTPERIRQWASRGRLIPHGLDPDRHPLYRIGDVQGLLTEAERSREARTG